MIPKDILNTHKFLEQDVIMVGHIGSISHGTYVPSDKPNSIDDKDIMAIVVPDIHYYYGLKEFGSRGTKVVKVREWDIVAYEVKKFIRLLAKGNPNVLGMLWLDNYLVLNDAGKMIVKERDLFTTKQVYHSFVGYAKGQLKRMTHLACKGYMGEKRKGLVEKYGYDTKNASHLIRLLTMGIEFLKTGKLLVKRPDAKFLIDIKQGVYSLEQIKQEADYLFKSAEIAYWESKLPGGVDMDAINRLCVRVVRRAHEG